MLLAIFAVSRSHESHSLHLVFLDWITSPVHLRVISFIECGAFVIALVLCSNSHGQLLYPPLYEFQLVIHPGKEFHSTTTKVRCGAPATYCIKSRSLVRTACMLIRNKRTTIFNLKSNLRLARFVSSLVQNRTKKIIVPNVAFPLFPASSLGHIEWSLYFSSWIGYRHLRLRIPI
jgi:hypothetical protein